VELTKAANGTESPVQSGMSDLMKAFASQVSKQDEKAVAPAATNAEAQETKDERMQPVLDPAQRFEWKVVREKEANVVLKGPELVAAPTKGETAKVEPARAEAKSGPASPAGVSDPLIAQLAARKATWWKAESGPNGVTFSCVVPDKQDPMIDRHYEVTAADYAAAVRAMLTRLDQQQ